MMNEVEQYENQSVEAVQTPGQAQEVVPLLAGEVPLWNESVPLPVVGTVVTVLGPGMMKGKLGIVTRVDTILGDWYLVWLPNIAGFPGEVGMWYQQRSLLVGRHFTETSD